MGPNSDNRSLLKTLMEEGMDIARFNFFHGTYKEQKERLDMLKSLREETGIPVAALKMMVHICEASEEFLDYGTYYQKRLTIDNNHNISNTVCYLTVTTAHSLKAAAIIAPSITGFTTRLLSK